MADAPATRPPALPKKPIDRVTGPLRRFLHVETSGGVVLFAASLVALLAANTPWGETWLGVWKTSVRIGVGSFSMDHSLVHWINDGLMAVFFFVIGLEVKRELVLGELRELRSAALPIAAALGGMLAPAAIYLALQGDGPGARGWGIPMATDIAFVVGCLALLGSRVPPGLRVLLVSLAIADDLGAILVIAIGYTESLDATALGLGVVGIGLVRAMALAGVRSVGLYTAVGAGVWLAFHESGIHATIAGVVLGLLTPTREWIPENLLRETVERAAAVLRGEAGGAGTPRSALRHVEITARESVSPLERLETALHPWASFAIVPLFALANAGVPVDPALFGDPIGGSVAIALFVGKPLGIVVLAALAVRLGLAELPAGVDWIQILAAGFLAGIGFTMSIFIASLGLAGDALQGAKLGVLLGSLASGGVGMALLAWRLPPASPGPPAAAH